MPKPNETWVRAGLGQGEVVGAGRSLLVTVARTYHITPFHPLESSVRGTRCLRARTTLRICAIGVCQRITRGRNCRSGPDFAHLLRYWSGFLFIASTLPDSLLRVWRCRRRSTDQLPRSLPGPVAGGVAIAIIDSRSLFCRRLSETFLHVSEIGRAFHQLGLASPLCRTRPRGREGGRDIRTSASAASVFP